MRDLTKWMGKSSRNQFDLNEKGKTGKRPGIVHVARQPNASRATLNLAFLGFWRLI